MSTRLPRLAAILLGLTLLTAIALKICLFEFAKYNVYRVLDLSIIDTLIIGGLLSIQFFVFLRVAKSFIPQNILKSTILALVFMAVLDASLAFWIHEESNKEVHLEYARQLAERRDTIAERILQNFASIEQKVTHQENAAVFWEKQWLHQPYLASNYRLQYHNNIKPGPADSYYQVVATIDASNQYSYRIYFPGDCGISITLVEPNLKSTYTENIAYKKLDQLHQYHFALVDHSKLVLKNSHDYDMSIAEVPLPPIGTSHKVKWKDYDVTVYQHSDDVFVVIGEPLSEFQVWWSNFAFFFGFSLVIALLFRVSSLQMPGQDFKSMWRQLPIQYRIQTTVISLTLILFFVIAATTFIFLSSNNAKTQLEQRLFFSESIRKELQEVLNNQGGDLQQISTFRLEQLSERLYCDLDLYASNGKLSASSIASATNSPAPKQLTTIVMDQIKAQPDLILPKKTHNNYGVYFRTIFGLSVDGQIQGYVAMNTFSTSIGSAQDIPVMMSSLLNVYITLLILTWLGGLLLTSLLNQPLKLLAERLSQFKVGQSNALLKWEGNDAIGSLIQEYNKMVHTVEETTTELIKSEREGAWQTMAQQIAHEVNNPLTPLRLNVQFLTRAFMSQQQPNLDAVKRITDNLVTQIDHLASVAAQFKMFAKINSPRGQEVAIHQFIETFTQSFNNKGQGLLEVRVDDRVGEQIIKIDQNHLETVLQNIITFQVGTLSEERPGCISIDVYMGAQQILIAIKDNGKGIPAEEWDNLFNPSFSTSGSQTGLGLPICKRIVEFYGGILSFDSTCGKGTTFSIAFPIASSTIVV